MNSSKKPARRGSRDGQQKLTRQWESMSDLHSPRKPTRRRSQDRTSTDQTTQKQLHSRLSQSMSALVPAPPLWSEDVNPQVGDADIKSSSPRQKMMENAGRWESMTSISVTSASPCRPPKRMGSHDGLEVMSASVGSLGSSGQGADADKNTCRRRILTSSNWSSLRTSMLSLSRRSLMSSDEKWESVSSDLSMARAIMEEDVAPTETRAATTTASTTMSSLPQSSRHVLRRPALQRTKSSALLSMPTTNINRSRKLLDSRGWKSFLGRTSNNGSAPEKLMLSASEEHPCTPPLQITVQLETSVQASVSKIESLRETMQAKRRAFASAVKTSQRNLSCTASTSSSSLLDLEDKMSTEKSEEENCSTRGGGALHNMDADRLLLMSKFKALNKRMSDTVAEKQARLAKVKLMNAPQPSTTIITPSSAVSIDERSEDETLSSTGFSQSSLSFASSESSSTCTSRSATMRRFGPKKGLLGKYLASTNCTMHLNKARSVGSSIGDFQSEQPSLPDLLSIREDDDDISQYF